MSLAIVANPAVSFLIATLTELVFVGASAPVELGQELVATALTVKDAETMQWLIKQSLTFVPQHCYALLAVA